MCVALSGVVFCLDFNLFFFFLVFPCRVFFLYLIIYLFKIFNMIYVMKYVHFVPPQENPTKSQTTSIICSLDTENKY
jgi:hypothetical protein